MSGFNGGYTPYAFGFNRTNKKVPVWSIAPGIGSGPPIIEDGYGYLNPGEMFVTYGSTNVNGGGDVLEIGYLSPYGWQRGAIPSSGVASEAFSATHASGHKSGNVLGYRQSYRTFGIRNTAGLYKKVPESNELLFMNYLTYGDKIGLLNGKNDYAKAQFSTPWFMQIHTYWISNPGRVGADIGGFPWQDEDCTTGEWYVDLGFLFGRTTPSLCNVKQINII